MDLLGEMNERIMKVIRKGMRASVKRDIVSQRVAAEYIIRMHKADLLKTWDFKPGEISEFIDKLESVKNTLGDESIWSDYGRGTVSSSIKKAQADVNRQIKYLKKIQNEAADIEKQRRSGTDISKDELSRMYKAAKRR